MVNKRLYHDSDRTSIPVDKWYAKGAPSTENAQLDKMYLGIVRDTRDPQRMGRILVWIPELTGEANLEENLVVCSYCSPFAGSTYFDDNYLKDKDGMDAISDLKTKSQRRTPTRQNGVFSGQQTYGMWFVPPDVGNEVIVSFINGDPNKAIWIGCLYQQDINYMVPGIAYDDIYTGENNPSSEQGPVIETDKSIETNNLDPRRKVYSPLHDGLKEFQGLDRDFARGQASSSARREAPSEVFGFLTPDGNQFVMDDNENNEFIRIRTKGGAQVIVNQTNGFVYAISRDGLSWLELSNEGNIDVYGKSNVSIHAEVGNINLKSGQDINIQALRDINIRAGRNITMLSEANTDIRVNQNMTTSVLAKYDLTSEANMNFLTNAKYSALSQGNMALRSNAEFGISAIGEIREQAKNVHMNTGPGPQPSIAQPAKYSPTYVVSGPAVKTSVWNPGEYYPEGTNIIARVPQHEPWPYHAVSVLTPALREAIVTSQYYAANIPTNEPFNPKPEKDAAENAEPKEIPNDTPIPEDGICGLTPEQSQQFLNTLGYRESGNNYTTQNSLGFSGKYQFGAAALVDAGQIDKEKYDAAVKRKETNAQIINNPDNWVNPGGVQENWLNNPEAQEAAMVKFTNSNCRTLRKNGVLDSNSTPQEVSGYLMAAHLGGAGNAINLKNGQGFSDAYGTSTQSYYDMGYNAIK